MIHYHGTPCGGTRQDTARFLAGRHAFVPFPRPDDLPVALDVCQSIALDNGAYSVWKQGGALDVEGYYQWVEGLLRHPSCNWAVIPDVIEGTEQANDDLVHQWPFGKPTGVPVWHLHESLDRLRFLSGMFPRIALGSSGQYAHPGDESWWLRMVQVMTVLCDQHGRPYCKVHGLRMLNPDLFTRLPFASADSTNAVRNGNLVTRFGIYPPPTLGQRQQVIADRIEAYQSAPCWVPWQGYRQGMLFTETEANDA